MDEHSIITDQSKLVVQCRIGNISVCVCHTNDATGEWEGDPDAGIMIPKHKIWDFLKAVADAANLDIMIRNKSGVLRE